MFEKLLETKNAERIRVLTATIADLRDAERRDEEMKKEEVDIDLEPLPQNLGVEEVIYYNEI